MSFPESAPPAEPVTPKPDQAPVVVKKYANRRLYNTESSSYITLDSLATMIRQSRDFVVYDAKTGEDITRGVLTQIIVEEESKGRAMLPTAFLRQIIGFYGDSLQQFVPSYLEQAMSSFAHQQEQMRSAMQQTMGNLFPGMQDISRQNMAMMERAMNLFAPFYRAGASVAAEQGLAAAPVGNETAGNGAVGAPEMEAMRLEIDSLRQQLAAARLTAITAPMEPPPEHAPTQPASRSEPTDETHPHEVDEKAS